MYQDLDVWKKSIELVKELGFIETIEDTLNNLKEIYKMTISLKKFYNK